MFWSVGSIPTHEAVHSTQVIVYMPHPYPRWGIFLTNHLGKLKMNMEDIKKNAPPDASGYIDFHGVTYHKEIQGSWYTWEKQWNSSCKWEFTHPSWIHKIKPID